MEESQSHCPEGQGVTVERGNREEFIKEIGGKGILLQGPTALLQHC
jgi:hypothetical protein